MNKKDFENDLRIKYGLKLFMGLKTWKQTKKWNIMRPFLFSSDGYDILYLY